MSDSPKAESLLERILAAVRAILPGSVATYGDIARAVGSPRAARQVGWALAGLESDSDVPWWRIVNASGAISARPSAPEQAGRLREEGVEVDADGHLDLARYRR